MEKAKQEYLDQLAHHHLGRLDLLDRLGKQLDSMKYDAEDTEPEYSEGYAAAVASVQGWVELQLHNERAEWYRLRKEIKG